MERPAIGTFILLLAFLLSLLVSISAPYVQDFDDVRTYFAGSVSGNAAAINEARFGIWGFCVRLIDNGNWVCESTGLAYSFALKGVSGNVETIARSWTRGLVMSPVATGFIFVALVLSFTRHSIFAAIAAIFAGFVTVIFMAINIALYVYVHSKMKHVGTAENTNFGPGFWMSLSVLILCVGASTSLVFAHRNKNAAAGSGYRYGGGSGFMSRFRR